MASYAPNLMYEHALTPLKGWVKSNCLDYSAPVSANVTFSIPQGRVMHVNSSGEFETGVNSTKMAIFAFNASDALTVTNPGTTSSGNFVHQAIFPTGVTSGLVATGGYELASSEFKTSDTYAPNNTLTADVANTTLATGGVLKRGTVYTSNICGVVSKGIVKNELGVDMLHFWPVYVPVV
jgi:hypothetical protein